MDNTISQTQSPFATEPIGRLIAKFAIPSVIALLVNSLYNIVDQIFIGWGVGYLGNGATNVVFPITIIALALSMMIGNGGAAYLSLKLGEGEVPAAKRGVGNAVSLAVIVSIVLAAVFLLCINPILTLFGATDILRPYALEYNEFAVKAFRIFLMLCPLTGFQTIAAVYLQAVGKPGRSAILSLARQIIFFVPAALILPAFLGVEGVLWTGPVADGLAFLLSLGLLVYERQHLKKAHRLHGETADAEHMDAEHMEEA